MAYVLAPGSSEPAFVQDSDLALFQSMGYTLTSAPPGTPPTTGAGGQAGPPGPDLDAWNTEAQFLWKDLNGRGGAWTNAAAEFWAAIQGQPQSDLDSIYMTIFTKYSSAPTTTTPTTTVPTTTVPTTTTPSWPKEGAIMMDPVSGHQLVYTNGQWVDTEITTPKPDDTAAKLKLLLSQAGGPWGMGGFQEKAPQAAWNLRMGLPAYGQNPYQAWLAQQLQPVRAGWMAGEFANQLQNPMAAPQPFDPYTTLEGMGGGFQQALQAFRTAGQLKPDEQGLWLEDIGAEEGPSLRQTLRAALRGRGYAGTIADILAQRLGGYGQAWQAETLGGATQGAPTFLQYLMSKYGF